MQQLNYLFFRKHSLFKCILCTYVYYLPYSFRNYILRVHVSKKFRTKDGEEGPRGYHGFPGDKGDPGKCNQQTCRPDVIRVMIEKDFSKKTR